MQTMVVCAAVIEKEGLILLAQRKAVGEQGLLWEFPGGKLIPGETPEECLVRELQEELNMLIEVVEVFEVVSHCYREDMQILLLAYLCRHLAGEGELLDCEDFRWVKPQELTAYPLAAADIPIGKKLISQVKTNKQPVGP